MGEMWIGRKRLILKLSQVLSVKEVKGLYMHLNKRLIPIQKWYDPRDIQLIICYYYIFIITLIDTKRAIRVVIFIPLCVLPKGCLFYNGHLPSP
jgi:hypothetical protein